MLGGRARSILGAALVATGLAACASLPREGTMATPALNGSIERIPLTVARPAGEGPFPAVVILHDCSGLGPRSSGAPGRWSRELVAHGYVTLLPDSFTTRGHPDGVCTDGRPSRGEVAPARRALDAYAALAHARALPFVDGRHVGLIGGSHGGSTTLAALAAADGAGDPLARAQRDGFAAAVARHSFDSDRPVRYVATRVNMNAPGGRGATTGGDPQAWADSIRRVTEFF